MKSAADKYQVDGDHYKNEGIPDHWTIAYALGWDYFTAAATKYLWRMGKKDSTVAGQIRDLDKAIHYLTKKRELMAAEYIQAREGAAEDASAAYVNQDR
jgi:hypothetical protein